VRPVEPEVNESFSEHEHSLPDDTGDIAESFLQDCSDTELGVGTHDAPESAMLQRALETILDNLKVDLSRLTINLENPSSDCDIRASLQSFTYGPRELHKTKEIQAMGLQVEFFKSDRAQRRNFGVRKNSVSSRSTSSSSFEDAELMQSTIFGRSEARSIYMSAMTGTSIYHSAIQEEIDEMEDLTGRDEAIARKHEESHSCQPGVIVSVEEGFNALMSIDEQLITLDVSCQTVGITLQENQVPSILALASHIAANRARQSRESVTQESASSRSALKLQLRVASVQSSFVFDELLATEAVKSGSALLPIKFILERTSFVTKGAGCSLNTERVKFMVGEEEVFYGKHMSEPFLDILWDEHQSIKGMAQQFKVSASLPSILTYVGRFSKMYNVIETCLPQTRRGTPNGVTQKKHVQLSCPEITVVLESNHVPLKLVLSSNIVLLENDDVKSRLTLQFRDSQVLLAEEILLSIQHETANAIDMTWMKSKPPQRALEFVNYEELFAIPDRTYKDGQRELQLIKQKSKETGDRISRISLGSVKAYLSDSRIDFYCSFIKDLFLGFQSAMPPASMKTDHITTPPFTSTVLSELDQLQVNIQSDLHHMDATLGRISIMFTHNMKNVDIFTVDILRIDVMARDLLDSKFTVLSEALHLHAAKTPRASPMFSVRARRNLKGVEKGNWHIRLLLTDTQWEYFADMPWLTSTSCFIERSLQKLNSLVSTTSPAAHDVMQVRLLLDVSNSSIALNPYTSTAKGLLYFRQSNFSGLYKSRGAREPISIHPGVVDLFLIDDIGGKQNDPGESKRIRRDPVSSRLIELGFVHVASIETIETKISLLMDNSTTTYQADISGAILTLTTCADSTATLVALVSMLRIPLVISDDLKYNLGSKQGQGALIDIFHDVESNVLGQCPKPLDGHDRTSRVEVVQFPSVDQGGDQLKDSGKVLSQGELSERFSGNPIGMSASSTQTLGGTPTGNRTESPDLVSGEGRVHKKVNVSARNCFVVWNLHDGYDWDKTRSRIAEAVDSAVAKAHKSGLKKSGGDFDDMDEDDDSESTDSNEVGDLLFNSIYIALPNGATTEDVTRSINIELSQANVSDTASQSTATGPNRSYAARAPEKTLQLGRSRMHKVRIEASGIAASVALFDIESDQVSNQVDLAIQDIDIIDNVSTSTWRKFLTYHRGLGSREKLSNMARFLLTTVKPMTALAAAELIVHAKVSPLRLHVDQDTLEFLTRFFEFKSGEILPAVIPTEEIFIQKFEIEAIPIQIDYKPKRVDFKSLRSGRTTEFKNFFILEDSNMILKHVILYGVCGFPRVFQSLNDIWLANIKSTQLGSVLAGVSPLRSMASFGGGLRDLVMLPVAEYKRDGTVVPGIRKGLTAFAKNTGAEAIRLGAKLAVGTQGILESAETMLNPVEAGADKSSTHAVSMYANQPRDLRQGVSQAMSGMARNVMTARDAITSLPRDLEGEDDSRGIVRVAAKSVPVAVIRPLIGTTEMISKTLLGLRNTINPDQRKLNEDKYK